MTSQALFDKLNILLNCNPDIPYADLQQIYSLAKVTPTEDFTLLEEFVICLMEKYLSSPPKQATYALFKEYSTYLERSARLLASNGKIPISEANNLIKSNQTMDLLPINISDYLIWCNIISHSEVPKPLKDAIFACQKRNEQVCSVIEIAFYVMSLVDSKKTTKFLLNYLAENNSDYDMIRDCLLTWLNYREPLPQEVLNKCYEWSGNDTIREFWPYVSVLTDQLLRQQVILKLANKEFSRIKAIEKLQRIGRREKSFEPMIKEWYEETLVQMSQSITFFINVSQKEKLTSLDQFALAQELKNLEYLYPLILVCADCSYDQPDGIRGFALAFFGLSGIFLEEWQDVLLKKSERAITMLSLRYMKENKSLDEFIERFTFGNQEECQRLQNKLDLATRSFSNLAARRYVLEILASFYASRREAELLAMEIAKRYRNWRRLVHEDYLRLCLSKEDFVYWQDSVFLQEINTLCGEIRKYLDKRRSKMLSFEELMAVEMDFSHLIREKRLNMIKELLNA